jgi:hypothetical protein
LKSDRPSADMSLDPKPTINSWTHKATDTTHQNRNHQNAIHGGANRLEQTGNHPHHHTCACEGNATPIKNEYLHRQRYVETTPPPRAWEIPAARKEGRGGQYVWLGLMSGAGNGGESMEIRITLSVPRISRGAAILDEQTTKSTTIPH